MSRARRLKSRDSGAELAAPRAAPTARPRASGSVAVRISAATSLVVAISMVVFTFVLYGRFAKALSEEIDAAGTLAVTVMSAVDLGAWDRYDGTVAEGRKPGDTSPVEVPNAEARKTFEAQISFNEGRSRRLVEAAGATLLDAVILGPESKEEGVPRRIVNGRNKLSFAPDGDARSGEGGVSILEGKYSGGSKATQARMYRKPILARGGAVQGEAVVALSVTQIDARLAKLRNAAILLTLGFIGLGLVVSWLISKRISKPIQLLTRDIEIVARGNLAHRTIAHSDDEVGVLARSFDHMTASLFEAQDLERRAAAQEHEMGIAQQVQEALIPSELPQVEGYECAGEGRAAGQVGGTSFDVLELPGGAQLFVLANASSAGLPGAMVVTMARSIIKALAPTIDSPAELLRRVNRILASDLRRGLYVSVLLVRLDPNEHEAVIVNAGHHPLLVCRPDKKSADAFHADGIALGFDKGPVFDRTLGDAVLPLLPGVRLVLCSGSLTRVSNPDGDELGEKRLYRLLAKESDRPSDVFVPGVLRAVLAFSGTDQPDEDLALLTVRRHP